MKKGLSLLFSMCMFLELLQTSFSQKEVRNHSCQSVLLVPFFGVFFRKFGLTLKSAWSQDRTWEGGKHHALTLL